MNTTNGNGVRLWWRGTAATALVAWMTWISLNVANYVTGEGRGERLSTDQAKLMVEQADNRLRLERDTKITELELRIHNRLVSLEEHLKILAERLRLAELKK